MPGIGEHEAVGQVGGSQPVRPRRQLTEAELTRRVARRDCNVVTLIVVQGQQHTCNPRFVGALLAIAVRVVPHRVANDTRARVLRISRLLPSQHDGPIRGGGSTHVHGLWKQHVVRVGGHRVLVPVGRGDRCPAGLAHQVEMVGPVRCRDRGDRCCVGVVGGSPKTVSAGIERADTHDHGAGHACGLIRHQDRGVGDRCRHVRARRRVDDNRVDDNRVDDNRVDDRVAGGGIRVEQRLANRYYRTAQAVIERTRRIGGGGCRAGHGADECEQRHETHGHATRAGFGLRLVDIHQPGSDHRLARMGSQPIPDRFDRAELGESVGGGVIGVAELHADPKIPVGSQRHVADHARHTDGRDPGAGGDGGVQEQSLVDIDPRLADQAGAHGSEVDDADGALAERRRQRRHDAGGATQLSAASQHPQQIERQGQCPEGDDDQRHQRRRRQRAQGVREAVTDATQRQDHAQRNNRDDEAGGVLRA